VLLNKPANREQLEIAKQLARRDCVLVQGPPGTGKTHTIANLLGHLLAQGKRVLVTAHTPKALRVLRQKVVEPFQPLCISVLRNDKQSQEELQASVQKIHVWVPSPSRLHPSACVVALPGARIIRAWRRSPPFKAQSSRSDKISYTLNLEHGTLNFSIPAQFRAERLGDADPGVGQVKGRVSNVPE